MPIFNPLSFRLIPLSNPTVSVLLVTPFSIRYRVTNTANEGVKIYYSLTEETLSDNFVNVAALSSQDFTISNLEEDTTYTLYIRSVSEQSFSEIVTITQTSARDTIYPFSSFTFTTGGISGRGGPSLPQIQNAYTSQSWTQNTNYLNMLVEGYQRWTVPMNGTYRIIVVGGSGGSSEDGNGGYAARIEGTFTLSKGTFMTLVVGHQGGRADTNTQAGNGQAGNGGGGSFVFYSASDFSTATVLMAAGGGGGTAAEIGRTSNSNASLITSGNNAQDGDQNGFGVGGTNGQGGTGGTNIGGQGGAGIFTNGGPAQAGSGVDLPQAIITSAIGGYNAYTTFGGFGGGGGYNGGGGGGGGYSGGGGGNWSTGKNAGGGGSFNSGSDQNNTITTSGGNGFITIIKL
jgi:hypothetical protein